MNRLTSTAAAATAAVIVLAVAAGCAGRPHGTPAYRRWGITKPADNKAAEARFAKAYELLYGMEFDKARAAYDELVKELPQSAEAHLGLSMALRYGRELDEAAVEARKALDLDPGSVGAQLNMADLVAPFRGARLAEPLTDKERVEQSTALLLKASTSPHPLAAYAHTQLWINYLSAGRLGEARAQLEELGRKDYFPSMLNELADNMLVALEPDAIIFTNGDNDTYPLLVRQQHDGRRRDVTVVNLSLLNLAAYARLMRDSMNVPVSWDDVRLDAFKPEYDSALGRPVLQSDLLVDDIIRNAPGRGRPVYFAATVVPTVRQVYRDRVVLEGLVWRVASEPPRDSVDFDKLVGNLTGKYQLGALGRAVEWSSNLSPITRNITGLSINYMALYGRAAERYQALGDEEQARRYFRRMYDLAATTGNREWMGMAIEYWLRTRPDDPEAKGLKEKLGGTS